MDTRELAAPPQLAAAGEKLLSLERRFGLKRDVEGGMHQLKWFSPVPADTKMDQSFAEWACRQVGVDTTSFAERPPRLQRNPATGKSELVTTLGITEWLHPPSPFAPATVEAVKGQLLEDERFGTRSEDDTAWFDPTPEGTAACKERDDALRALLGGFGGPARFSVVVDRSRDGLLGVSVLAGPAALAVFTSVAMSVQLSSGAHRDTIC